MSSSLFEDHMKLVQKTWRKTAEQGTGTDLPDQLALYLRAPAEHDMSESPLKYWHNMNPAAPELSAIAVKYLTAPSTSVPSERLFSKAGSILTQERNRLKGKMLGKLLFLQSVEENYFF